LPPAGGYEHIRLLISDLNLDEIPATQELATVLSPVITVIQQLVGTQQGPYILVFWTGTSHKIEDIRTTLLPRLGVLGIPEPFAVEEVAKAEFATFTLDPTSKPDPLIPMYRHAHDRGAVISLDVAKQHELSIDPTQFMWDDFFWRPSKAESGRQKKREKEMVAAITGQFPDDADMQKKVNAAFEKVSAEKKKILKHRYDTFKQGVAAVEAQVAFLGLAVPGAPSLSPLEDLVAVWKSTRSQRFQNYRAKMTILDVACVSREWLRDIKAGLDPLVRAPVPWSEWIRTGSYAPLRAVRAREIRSKHEQLPPPGPEANMLSLIHAFFAGNPVGFEACAVAIVRMALAGVTSIDLTRPTRDGGRDAVGLYQIGTGASAVSVEFALEAKCYGPENSVGVKELSRLISRLRHRQFGIMVTTSWIHSQAYTEIKEDRHPIMIIAGADMIRILKGHGISSAEDVQNWLARNFDDGVTAAAV
jgi:hypothetical protein